MAIRRFKLDYISNIMEQNRQSPNVALTGPTTFSHVESMLVKPIDDLHARTTTQLTIALTFRLSSSVPEQKHTVIRASAFIYQTATGPSYVCMYMPFNAVNGLSTTGKCRREASTSNDLPVASCRTDGIGQCAQLGCHLSTSAPTEHSSRIQSVVQMHPTKAYAYAYCCSRRSCVDHVSAV